MPLIDDRGRLFGKVNLIDAAAAAFVFLLMPIAYGAYVLFRTPAPTVSALRPATIAAGQDTTVEIQGTNFLPFLRARVSGPVGMADATAFLLENPSRAEIKLPKLPPGTYDLILYDTSQELTRREGALTVIAPVAPAETTPPLPPPPTVIAAQALGIFTNLTQTEALALRVGLRFGAEGGAAGAEVLALKPPEPGLQRIKMGPQTSISSPAKGRYQVSAILAVRCVPAPDGCYLGSGVVDRTGLLFLPKDGRSMEFLVQEVRSPDSPAMFPDVMVRVLGTFTGLDADRVRQLRIGTRFPDAGTPVAEVLSLDRAEPAVQSVPIGPGTVMAPLVGSTQMAAVIRVRCTSWNDGCRVADTVLAKNVTISLSRGGALFRFLINDVQPLREPARARILVQFVTRPEVRALMKIGDVDASALIDGKESAASLTLLGMAQNIESGVGISLDPNPDPNRRPFPHQVPQKLVGFDATLNIVAEQGREGLQYRGELVKVGAGFAFDTAQYTIRGWILEVEILERTAPAPTVTR